MRCGCRSCGALMDHKEQGVFSKCICPQCGEDCAACLGTNTVMTVGQIKKLAQEIEQKETK